jgi:hypothetical protein
MCLPLFLPHFPQQTDLDKSRQTVTSFERLLQEAKDELAAAKVGRLVRQTSVGACSSDQRQNHCIMGDVDLHWPIGCVVLACNPAACTRATCCPETAQNAQI